MRPTVPVLAVALHATRAGPRRAATAALWLLCVAGALGGYARAQSPASGSDAQAASAESRSAAIAPADIPARADVDEKFVQAVLRRAQVGDKVMHFEQALEGQALALQRLTDLTAGSDLSQLSVNRLESLERHWRLQERAIGQTRAELARATTASSEDVAKLVSHRAAWKAARDDPTLAPALLQRIDEMIVLFDRAQQALAAPLAKMLDLGRIGSSLSAQVQSGMAAVVREVEDQDRRLATMDAAPLWLAVRDAGTPEPVATGLFRSIEIETAFARDYDKAHGRLLPALAAGGALLLPLLFWLKRRAARLVAAAQASESAMQALSRPWAAWLLLVAVGAVLYNVQGPIIRQQLVMLLAWVPVLGLLQRRILSVVGPWAYLSAVFYFLNVVVSLLVANPLLYRFLLLAINLLMLVTLGWRIARARRADNAAAEPLQAMAWSVLRWAACGVLVVAAGSNIMGNVSLSAMLLSATLDSSYVALAIYVGGTVLLALFQVLLAEPTVSRLARRHSASLVPAVLKLGRLLLAAAWLVFTLQAFRVYRPLSSLLVSVLTHEFKLGELSLSAGNVAAFAVATWAAFWLARTIRLVLAEDVLPALSLPRGVGGSISSLSYYTVLFLGLLAALAAAGFHVGQLALVFGALGVGIGFGLQDVVKNFVAGLILMFERPIQRGDTVEVAGMTGMVRDIGLRATTVTTFDGADVVVPNGMLLADKLVNWTHSGTRRRINLDVSTGYGADPRRTIELLVGIARGIEGISAAPAPTVIMTSLAPGSLEFNVRAWTTDRADWVEVRSELAVQIRDGLAEAGIEVPVPQRALHLHSVSREAARELGRLGATPDSPANERAAPGAAAPDNR